MNKKTAFRQFLSDFNSSSFRIPSSCSLLSSSSWCCVAFWALVSLPFELKIITNQCVEKRLYYLGEGGPYKLVSDKTLQERDGVAVCIQAHECRICNVLTDIFSYLSFLGWLSFTWKNKERKLEHFFKQGTWENPENKYKQLKVFPANANSKATQCIYYPIRLLLGFYPYCQDFVTK